MVHWRILIPHYVLDQFCFLFCFFIPPLTTFADSLILFLIWHPNNVHTVAFVINRVAGQLTLGERVSNELVKRQSQGTCGQQLFTYVQFRFFNEPDSHASRMWEKARVPKDTPHKPRDTAGMMVGIWKRYILYHTYWNSSMNFIRLLQHSTKLSKILLNVYKANL